MVHRVLCNRRSSFGAAWGVRTTGTNVSGCASGATVSGAEIQDERCAGATQVQHRGWSGKRARQHLGGAARGRCGRPTGRRPRRVAHQYRP